MRTVGEVCELAGVSVRTLHHYDEIGLLAPSGRSDAGYRLYSHQDLERLQEILVWRQLGFGLQEIQRCSTTPSTIASMRSDASVRWWSASSSGWSATAVALDEALTAARRGTSQEGQTMFRDFDPAHYEDEARERWGDADAYRESARRTAAYGEAEWTEIRSEAERIVEEFAKLMRDGEPATGERAQAVAERHRQHITRWFYPVSTQMHRGLAEMYVADPRFAAGYEKVAPGLAAYVRDAVLANARARNRA